MKLIAVDLGYVDALFAGDDDEPKRINRESPVLTLSYVEYHYEN